MIRPSHSTQTELDSPARKPYGVDVAAALLARARALRAPSLAVVGTSKNAGKSVVVAALADALQREGSPYGICSLGRDGEAADALDAAPKPRLYLRPGAVLATAVTLLPRSPALEIVALTDELSAVGRIVLARVRAPGRFEIAGPASAAALRRIASALAALVPFVLIDGAVDRIAALADEPGGIVVAVGAAGAPTAGHALDDVAALVARLRLPLADPVRDSVDVPGALTAALAAQYAGEGERRQVVVRDGTRVTFGGRAYLELASRLDLRCRRALHPIACTVAPLAVQRAFEPAAFLGAVAERTGLPTFDVYAGVAA